VLFLTFVSDLLVNLSQEVAIVINKTISSE